MLTNVHYTEYLFYKEKISEFSLTYMTLDPLLSHFPPETNSPIPDIFDNSDSDIAHSVFSNSLSTFGQGCSIFIIILVFSEHFYSISANHSNLRFKYKAKD